MNPWRRWVILAMVPLLAGCFREPTAAQRWASFQSLSDARVDDLSLADHTARRTVYLLATPAGDFVTDQPGRLVLTNVRAGASEVQLYTGTAAVLTRDGYLLTAAHCAATPNLTVIPARVEGAPAVGALRPRVVWFGKSGDPLTDLAILKVDAPFPEAFEWSDDHALSRRSAVALAGIDLARYRLAFSYAAGRVIDPAWMTADGPPIHAVTHDAPLRRGDSGGPLVTTDGRLAAINVAVRFGLGPQFSVSLRPDPEWVREIVARDRALNSDVAAAR
jgi:S1-C subfamily serine protease